MLEGNVLLTNLFPSWRFAISSNGTTIAAPCCEQGRNTVRLWDRLTRQVIQSIPAPDPVLGDLAFSPDGSALAWVTPRTLEIVDLPVIRHDTVSVDRKFEFQGFVPLAFSPATKEIAFTCQRNVMLYDLNSRLTNTFASCNEEPYALAYSPDGALLAIGLNKGTIALWDRRSGRKLSEQSAHTNLTACVTFSKDGKWLASCGTLTIKLWRVSRDGLKYYKTLEDHAGYIPAVAFSPDGKRLVSASSDHTLKLWDTADGMEVGTLYGHTAWISDVEFSRDGNTIFSMSQDGTLRTWEAPPLRRPD